MAVVLCVSGPEHIHFEILEAGCFLPSSPSGEELHDDGGRGCAGCTDISMEIVSDRDQGKRQHIAPVLAPLGVVPALHDGLRPVRECATEDRQLSLPFDGSKAGTTLRC